MNENASSYRIEIDRVSPSDWDTLLGHFSDATIYQTHAYGSVRWGSHRLSHLVLFQSNHIVAAAQVAIRKLPLMRCGIAYIPWGPLWRIRNEEPDPDRLRQIVRALRKEYTGRRGLHLRIRPHEIEEPDSVARAVFLEEGCTASPSHPYRTLLVDLQPSPEEIRGNLNRTWRRHLKTAEQQDFEVDQGTDDSLYATFLELSQDMLQRKGFSPGVNYLEFREIQRLLPDRHKMRILICRDREGPLASVVSSAGGDLGIYLLGATSTRGMQTQASYLLHWNMALWVKEQGCRWYDLGGINPETNPGVHFFKSGLAGKTGRDIYHLGQFDIPSSAFNEWAIRTADSIRVLKRKGISFLKERPDRSAGD